MSKTSSKESFKKFILFLIGNFILILGITLVLVWWVDVVRLFRAAVGMILALAGLLVLYSLKK
jgi:hypothetical protein